MATPSEQRVSALEGIRVLDLSNEFGMYCGKLLGDLGADVVKVEPPGGDPERNLGPFYQNTPDPNKSLFYWYFNTSKRSITLNLHHSDGQELLRRLVPKFDVVIETFPPGTLDRWGLGFNALHRQNPGLVVVSISGFGQTGPHRDFKTSDMVAYAMSGLMYVSGDPDHPPAKGPASPSHYIPSAHGAQGALLALWVRDTLGKGQHVDISMQESLLSFLPEFGVARYSLTGFVLHRWYGLDRPNSGSPFGSFQCKDGWVSCLLLRPDQWSNFASWIYEVTEDITILDERFEGGSADRAPLNAEVRPLIEGFFMRFNKEELYEEGQRRHITIAPVRTVGDLPANPQLEYRNYWTSVEHPELAATLTYPGGPYLLSETPWRVWRRAPLPGEHNKEVYSQELGISSQELITLRKIGAI